MREQLVYFHDDDDCLDVIMRVAAIDRNRSEDWIELTIELLARLRCSFDPPETSCCWLPLSKFMVIGKAIVADQISDHRYYLQAFHQLSHKPIQDHLGNEHYPSFVQVDLPMDRLLTPAEVVDKFGLKKQIGLKQIRAWAGWDIANSPFPKWRGDAKVGYTILASDAIFEDFASWRQRIWPKKN